LHSKVQFLHSTNVNFRANRIRFVQIN